MSSSNNNNNYSKPIFSLNMAPDTSSEPSSSNNVFKDHDRLLPIANVGRIMKQILPSNAKISKEAKETMQECVSEFIGFVTGEASEKCRKERRKTVNGDDICWAMGNLGFDDYAGPLKRYLDRYREFEGDRANNNINQNNNIVSNTSTIGNHQINRVNNSEELLEENFLLYTNTSNKPPNY